MISAVLLALLGSADPGPAHADVSYGPHPHQLIDIYVPSKGPGPYPVLLWFGGIWRPARHPARPDFFGNAGCAVIAVQTRTMTDATDDGAAVPIAYVAEDACRAVQFVRQGARKWDLDPDRIAVGGGSQGALPALYVACAGERSEPRSDDPVARASTAVRCAAAYRGQPTIDPKRMQEWVPGVKWGAPALGCSFEESLRRREEFLPSRSSPNGRPTPCCTRGRRRSTSRTTGARPGPRPWRRPTTRSTRPPGRSASRGWPARRASPAT